MTTYEANWESAVLVTAEAVYGIGSAMESHREVTQKDPHQEITDEAAD
ncbi:MAG: hypothetical protein ACOY93_20100 [Bacillota bacterium]